VEMQWIRSLWIWEANTFSESNLQLWKIVHRPRHLNLNN
jgi:hypothetical protein